MLQGEVIGYEAVVSLKTVTLEIRMCHALSFIYVGSNKVWLLTGVWERCVLKCCAAQGASVYN